MLQWALTHYQARFIMRASPQTFVNLPALHTTLQNLCNSSSCQHERLYLGSEVINATIDSVAIGWVLHSTLLEPSSHCCSCWGRGIHLCLLHLLTQEQPVDTDLWRLRMCVALSNGCCGQSQPLLLYTDCCEHKL